jgi:hypothetical protein
VKVDVEISYWRHEIKTLVTKRELLYQELKDFEKVLQNRDETITNLEIALEHTCTPHNKNYNLMVKKDYTWQKELHAIYGSGNAKFGENFEGISKHYRMGKCRHNKTNK